MSEKLLTVREVAQYLGITEKEVLDLVELGKIPAYKIGGVYLRFKSQDIENFKKVNFREIPALHKRYTLKEKILDFFYYYDFYILASLIILILLFFILKS